MSQQIGRLAGEDSNSYEMELEQTNRKSSNTDDHQEYEIPDCLARSETQQIEVSVGISFTCYGCRVCGQSQEYLYLPQGVVAVLDTSADKLIAQKQGQLRVNWSLKRALFDFDWVVIAHATDEDIERFAVQVGNDTDPLRQPRYHHMQCVIAPSCHLSENTLRVLRHTFGQVGYTKNKRI